MLTALVMTALLLGVGGAVDIAKLQSDKQYAQDYADSVGLSSAIFVSQNHRTPRNMAEGFMHGEAVSIDKAKDKGHKGSPMAVTVNYDLKVDEDVYVEVSGKTNTMIMHMFGFGNVDFTATSTTKFRSNVIRPNSVALVLDNSGSMWFDDRPADCGKKDIFCKTTPFIRPANAKVRMDALKSAAKSFLAKMTDMNARYEKQYPTKARAVRTAMLAYNEQNIPTMEKPFHWGVIEDADINSMTPFGGTNSFPSMGKVLDWMKNEDAIHMVENQEKPIKYVIWLTDGMNTAGQEVWTPEEGTNYWRTQVEVCNWNGCRLRYVYEEGRLFDSDGNEIDDFDGNGVDGEDNSGGIEIESFPPNNEQSWQEGRLSYSSDHDTLEECVALKQNGVEIYAIGFALRAGVYYTNDWQYLSGATETYKIPRHVKNNALHLMTQCATSADHVMMASNGEQLNRVFDRIGNKLAEESIRIAD